MMNIESAENEERAMELFVELLDADGPITIGGYEYEVSEVLRSVDPIAFRTAFLDYADSLEEDELS